VILMTAHGTPEMMKGALGAYRVVSKPFEVHRLADLASQGSVSPPARG
jgi:DNA-binding NtrC family response regulator